MFNITIFDGPSLGDCPGQAAGGGGHDGWEVAVSAGVPSLLALIAVLVVIRQNLERLRALIDSVNQCLSTLARCLPARQDVAQVEVEMDAVVVVQSPTIHAHPNLSDEERLRCQENRQRQDRMRWM